MSKTFQAILHIENSDRKIKPGLTAYVKLLLKKMESRIVVPTGAILIEGENNYVMVMEKNRAVRYDVETGETNNNQTVISKGLLSGSALIVKGHHIVSDGTSVKVID